MSLFIDAVMKTSSRNAKSFPVAVFNSILRLLHTASSAICLSDTDDKEALLNISVYPNSGHADPGTGPDSV